MSKEKESLENETGFSEKQTAFITNLFTGKGGIFDRPQGQGGDATNDLKELEAIKLILSMIGNKEFIKSATNLPEGELDDINDAEMINSYADCPELDEYIKNRLELSRSRIQPNGQYNNLLRLLTDISGKTGMQFSNMGEYNKILGKMGR